jgi:hypothetical protein
MDTEASIPQTQKEKRNMTTKILIEFDPKDASPLEVISTLEKMMQSNLEEGKVSEYSLALEVEDDQTTIRFLPELLVARAPKEELQPEPKQETPT